MAATRDFEVVPSKVEYYGNEQHTGKNMVQIHFFFFTCMTK